ncbi:hypothetical protein D3C81_601650 [compost metagenome]
MQSVADPTDTHAQAYATAIAAGRADFEVAAKLGGMLADHLAVEDEATGAQHYTTPGAHQPRPGKVEFQLAHAFAQGIAVAWGKVLQPFGTRSQLGM